MASRSSSSSVWALAIKGDPDTCGATLKCCRTGTSRWAAAAASRCRPCRARWTTRRRRVAASASTTWRASCRATRASAPRWWSPPAARSTTTTIGPFPTSVRTRSPSTSSSRPTRTRASRSTPPTSRGRCPSATSTGEWVFCLSFSIGPVRGIFAPLCLQMERGDCD